MERFDHEKLEVFNVALAFTGRAYVLAQEAPRGSGDLADQLRRASSSTVLNIAEGAGEYALGAKRSATECAALVELSTDGWSYVTTRPRMLLVPSCCASSPCWFDW